MILVTDNAAPINIIKINIQTNENAVTMTIPILETRYCATEIAQVTEFTIDVHPFTGDNDNVIFTLD